MSAKVVKQEKIVLAQSVGIDVSMDKIDCFFCYMMQDRSIETKSFTIFENSLKGFAALLAWTKKWLKPEMELSFVMEATGVYYENLAYFFSENTDYKVVVLLPNKSKAYKQSLNAKSKTDKIDAKVLAMMGLERCLDKWQAPSKSAMAMKELCREREALLENKTMILNQLHADEHSAKPNTTTVARTKKHIQFIEKQLLQIDKEIKETIKKEADLSLKINRLCTIPGVGLITAIVVLSETNNFALFRNKQQLISYAGLDVVENQSGKSAGKPRISKKGNSRVRKALYFPAMAHIRAQSVFTPLFDRIYEHSKVKMKAYVAIQRKLLVLMYTLVKNGTDFNPLYSKSNPVDNEQGLQIGREKKQAALLLPTVHSTLLAPSTCLSLQT